MEFHPTGKIQQGRLNREVKVETRKFHFPVESSLLNLEPFKTSSSVNARIRAFTLLEVLLALFVIAFISGLIIGLARHANHAARRHQARADLSNWHEALHRWHARFGEYPDLSPDTGTTTNEVLHLYLHEEILDFDEKNDPEILRIFYEQTGTTTNRESASLLHLNLKDPWGMPYLYHRDPDHPDTFHLWSTGPDSNQKIPETNIRLTP